MAFLDRESFGGIIPSNVKVHSRYNFMPSIKTLEILGIGYNVNKNDLFAVLNATEGEVLYNPFDSGKYGTLKGNTLVFDLDTTSMNETDSIYIYLLDIKNQENENKIITVLENIYSKINNQSDFFNNILT